MKKRKKQTVKAQRKKSSQATDSTQKSLQNSPQKFHINGAEMTKKQYDAETKQASHNLARWLSLTKEEAVRELES